MIDDFTCSRYAIRKNCGVDSLENCINYGGHFIVEEILLSCV